MAIIPLRLIASSQISSQISGHFHPPEELADVPYSARYQAGADFSLKLMSTCNFCRNRILKFISLIFYDRFW